MVWNWKSHEGSLHGAFLDGKIKSKTGERITSNKDRIKATLKSGFYLRGCWGRGEGIKMKPCLAAKIHMFIQETVTISWRFSLVKPLKKKVARNTT